MCRETPTVHRTPSERRDTRARSRHRWDRLHRQRSRARARAARRPDGDRLAPAVETTERIARAVERASRRPSVVVSGSAVGIYGMREDDRELDESAPAGDDVL